ncbi:jg20565 [Pararge aegeria aegeria]|uniref:Jg20565 protein n=1 Tax=Pararge aegeria aegeria TaxID=348720 RepID=A0A8S4QIE8_9NEOP|nr:jg20565 [Pararge aegeria aegeria]
MIMWTSVGSLRGIDNCEPRIRLQCDSQPLLHAMCMSQRRLNPQSQRLEWLAEVMWDSFTRAKNPHGMSLPLALVDVREVYNGFPEPPHASARAPWLWPRLVTTLSTKTCRQAVQ